MTERRAWSSTPTASGSSPQHASNGSHRRLHDYELKRRTAYTSKFDSMSLRWKAYRDLLSASLSETSRAHRVVLGTSHAHELYAKAMMSIHKDVYLDEKGNLATEKQQKRLELLRSKTNTTIDATKNSSSMESLSVIREVRQSQKDVADRFSENATNMNEEIAEGGIGALLEDVKLNFATIEELGSAILSELEKTELEVTQAWGNYLSSRSAIVSGSLQESAVETGATTDSWVVEMQYRVAAAYQNNAWEKGSSLLLELFERVKEEECTRRMNLREFLVAFTQRQQRLLHSLPGIQHEVLEELVGRNLTVEETREHVQVIIEHQTVGQEGPFEVPPPEDLLCESPLESDQLSKSKVVYSRRPGNNSGWTAVIAVLTTDSYLHLFDLNKGKSTTIGDNPETAFQSLLPDLVVPTTESVAEGKGNFSADWCQSFVPMESLILGNCTIRTKDAQTFELVETIVTKGAQKMFGKTGSKTVQVRSASKAETDEWIAILTAR